MAFLFFQRKDQKFKFFLEIKRTSTPAQIRNKTLIKRFKQLKEMFGEYEKPVSYKSRSQRNFNKISVALHDLAENFYLI